MSSGQKIVLATHQPNYLPWLGYFYKIYQSDVFVFLDDVQFIRKGMQNYTYIKTSNGSFRLKFPVKESRGDLIREVTSKDELGWKDKHLTTIEYNYRKAPYFDEVFDDYKTLIERDYINIAVLNEEMIRFFSSKLNIKTRFVNSSELEISTQKEQRIIDICLAMDASVYYSGSGAKAYQDENNFKKNGIELRYSVFNPVEYEQLWNGFQSNVSALDYFMNCGYDWHRILAGQK